MPVGACPVDTMALGALVEVVLGLVDVGRDAVARAVSRQILQARVAHGTTCLVPRAVDEALPREFLELVLQALAVQHDAEAAGAMGERAVAGKE